MKDEQLYRILKNRKHAVAMGLFAALLVFCGAFLLSFKSSYQSYWQAIYRVQTVDFNMLAHAFPALVREHIVENERESLKRVLESNFSAFKMAVDVCVDPHCSAYKEWVSNDGHTRGALVELPVFKSKKVPVTLHFEHPYSEKPLVTAVTDHELLGRLRLYRVNPPELGEELLMFAQSALRDKSYRSRYIAYSANLYFSLFLSITFFLLFVLFRNYILDKRLRKGIATLLRKGVKKNYV